MSGVRYNGLSTQAFETQFKIFIVVQGYNIWPAWEKTYNRM